MDTAPILFFAPDAGIAPHFMTACIAARTLKEAGHRVLFVLCPGPLMYRRCTVMDMYQLPGDEGYVNHRKCCAICLRFREAALNDYGLDAVNLGGFVTPEVEREAASILARLPGDPTEFRHDGVPFGWIAAHDLALSTKICDFGNLDDGKAALLRQHIRSALFSYLAVRELCRRRPISRLVHYNDYAMLLAARLAAEKEGVPACTLSSASYLVVDRRRINVMPGMMRASDWEANARWPRYRNSPLLPAQVREVGADVLDRFIAGGNQVYSPATTSGDRDLRRELGVPEGSKLLAAFTSSLDERMAADALARALNQRDPDAPQPFRDQIEWLEALTGFAASRNDVFLAVRIHPREGSNRREKAVSQHLVLLRERFLRPRPNCRFIWPDDAVSSYELAEAADVGLTSWSTIGIEMARLGIPVLSSTSGLLQWPHDDFHEWGSTPAAYFGKLLSLLRRPPGWGALVRAFRWSHLFLLGRSVDFGDLIPRKDYAGLPEYRPPREAGSLVAAITGRENIFDINYAARKRAHGPDPEGEEESAVRAQARRILQYLFTGEAGQGDHALLAVISMPGDPEDPARNPGLQGLSGNLAVALLEGDRVTYIRDGRSVKRRSPAGRRLALLACDAAYAPAGPVPERAVVLATGEELAGWLAEACRTREPGKRAVGGEGIHSGMDRIAALEEGGRLEEAHAVAARLAEVHPGCPDLLNLLGRLEALTSREEQALARFRRIAGRWPGFGKARINLAILLWKRGEKQEALEHARAASSAVPEHPGITRNLAGILHAMGTEREAEDPGTARDGC